MRNTANMKVTQLQLCYFHIIFFNSFNIETFMFNIEKMLVFWYNIYSFIKKHNIE
jgi:hypothetical protein